MTLVASGELGMRSINAELGRSTSAEISLDTAENGGYGAINQNSRSRPSSANPAAISEWYSYNHFAGPPTPTTFLLPEVAFAADSNDSACRNTILGRYRTVYGNGPALQDSTLLYVNARGDSFATRGFYAEGFTQYWVYWSGSAREDEGFCRF
jgi:hypothetical protein